MRELMWNIRNVRFVSIDEVYENKALFRNEISNFDDDTREIYKWYFYHQLCLMPRKRQPLKDLMWEYLVGQNVDLELAHQYRLYSITKEKYNKEYSVRNTQS